MSTPAATTGPLRRVPVQGRSVARVQRMLDACAELVDEVGYEGLTTTLLAERAEVAIGSVYQFFPDKRAIVQALTLRTMEAYLQRLDERFAGDDLTNWWDGVDAAIDEYITMHRTVPGFRTLHFGDVVDLHLLDEERDNNGVIADQLARVLVERFGLADVPRAAVHPGDRGRGRRRADQAGVPPRARRRRAGAGRGQGADPGVPAPPGRGPRQTPELTGAVGPAATPPRGGQRNAWPSPR